MIHILLRKIHIFLLDLKYFKQRSNSEITSDPLIIIFHDLYKYGGEILALNIVKQLTNSGYNILVISLRPGPLYEELKEIATVNIVSKRKLHQYVHKLSKSNHCRKVICNTVIAGDCSDIFKKEGFTVVTLIHEMENSIKGQFGNRYVDVCQNIAKNSNIVIFPSTYVMRSFLNCAQLEDFNYGIHDQGLYFKENEIMSEDDIKEIFREHSIPKDVPLVINVAVGTYRKGFDLFLDVVKRSREIDKNIYFIWIGSEVEDIYKQKVKQYGLGAFENLRLFGYIDDVKMLSSINKYAKILFLSSREDPFPAVVLNSFAVGTPVIAFEESGGFVDVIREEQTGFLIPPFDIEAVCLKICQTVYNNVLLESMEKECMAEIKKHSFEEYCNYLMGLFAGD